MSVPEPPQYDLADYVRKLRKDADLTQQELADQSGIGISTIRQIENRVVRAPKFDTLRLFATAFQRDVGEFVALIPGMQEDDEPANGESVPRFLARRATDAGISLRAREMAEAYDRLPALAQLAIDALLKAFPPKE